MSQRTWLAVGIIFVVVIAPFLFSVPRATEVQEEVQTSSEVLAPPKVSLKDTFKKGVHTLTGTVEAPNACATVSAEAQYDETADDAPIVLALSMSVPEDRCLQVKTEMRFTTTVTAPANVPVQITVNGVPVTLE